MKVFTKALLTLFLAIQVNIFSQITNGGFENWSGGNPVGWQAFNFPGFPPSVSQTNQSYTGTSAARLDVVDFSGSPLFPFLYSEFFTVDQQYGSLMGYFQFQPANDDEFFLAEIYFYSGNNVNAFGFFETFDATSGYTQFIVPIEYFGRAGIDSAQIIFGLADTSKMPQGPYGFALIDELTFGPSVGVTEISSIVPDDYGLTQNYPNPFNPSTKIHFSVPEQSYVELMVYDILGNEITTLVSDTYSAGEYSIDFIADNLPAGVYLARISAGKYSNTIKMTLLK
jgi:hypothetical protein